MTGCEDRGIVRRIETGRKRIEIEEDIHRGREGWKGGRFCHELTTREKLHRERKKTRKKCSQAQTSYTGLVQYVSCSTN